MGSIYQIAPKGHFTEFVWYKGTCWFNTGLHNAEGLRELAFLGDDELTVQAKPEEITNLTEAQTALLHYHINNQRRFSLCQ